MEERPNRQFLRGQARCSAICTRGEARETARCLGPRSPLPLTASLFSLPIHSWHRQHRPVPSTAAMVSSPPPPPPPPSSPAPTDPAVRPTATRFNEALLRLVREYEAGGRDSAAQIDVGRVPVLNRSSPFASTRPAGLATRSAAVLALQIVGIRPADPSTTGFFPRPH
jgi:hypothetical protein